MLLPVSLTQEVNHMTASDSEATGDFKVPTLTDERFIYTFPPCAVYDCLKNVATFIDALQVP